MGKLWNVKIDEQMYNLELKGKKLLVNGEDIKLKKYMRFLLVPKRHFWI